MSDLESGWRALVSGETRTWWAPAARGALGLLSTLYSGVVGGYRALFDAGVLRTYPLPCAVISVGNLTLGGTGKTTTVRWLVRRMLEWDLRPAVLSYGYRAGEGGKKQEGVRVVAGPEGVRLPVEVSGDEAQLLARSLPGVPVLIGKKRVVSGRRAHEEFHVDACVLDDAFQYWRLRKDLDIALVNATNPFGYGRVFPRGTLREPLCALRRADAAIITHAAWIDDLARARLREELRERNPRMVLAEARHIPVRLRDQRSGEHYPLERLRNGRWLALSSLGSPESFEQTLEELGASGFMPARFPDHHPYSVGDFPRLRDLVARHELSGIVTTEKDSVKISADWLGDMPCCVLEIDLQFLSGQDDLESLLRRRVSEGRSRSEGRSQKDEG